MKRIALLALLLTGVAAAQIAAPVEHTDALLEELDLEAPEAGFTVDTVSHGGLLFELNGTADGTDGNFDRVGLAVGVATGMGEGIAEPVAEFLETNLEAIAADGGAEVQVEGSFLLTLETTETDGDTVLDWRVSMTELPAELFPEARHALGADPDEARVTIREFADLQCPHCATFAIEVMPQLEELLAEDPGLRFEYHHLPLVSIHANALPAAEAAECVADLNGGDSFFTFSRLAFERVQAWQGLGETGSYFRGLAQEADLDTEGLDECLSERRHLTAISEAMDTAILELGLNGTPAVFVDGFRVQAWNTMDSYRRLIDLIDARSESP